MIFLPLRMGGAGRIFPESPSVRLPFTFPKAVDSAHAVLQSFHVQLDDGDSEVSDLRVALTTFFDPVQSRTSGEVQIEVHQTVSDAFLQVRAHITQVEVRLLVIGI
jgi:hypothetical protein